MDGLSSLFGGGSGGSKEFGRSSADVNLSGRDSGGVAGLSGVVVAVVAFGLVALVVVFGLKLAKEA